MSHIQSNYFNGFLNSSIFFFFSLTGSQKIFTVHPSFMEISSLKSGAFKVFFNPVSNFLDHYFILSSNYLVHPRALKSLSWVCRATKVDAEI